MLEGCPAPQVVPVPVSDCLTKTPADVSETVAALETKGFIKIDGNHVNWTAADS